MPVTTTIIPNWNDLAEHFQTDLGFTENTIRRIKHSYNDFVTHYCVLAENADRRIEKGIERVNKVFETGKISKDKLLRLRRIAFRMLQLVQFGKITWDRIPLYGKIYGNASDEAILASYIKKEHEMHKHAESIIKRDEGIVRQYILFAESNDFNILKADAQNIIDFLSYMKSRRPAGLQSITSALKHFYEYLIETDGVNPTLLLAIKTWDTPHKRVYGILSNEEKQLILNVINPTSDIGKRDKAIIMLAIDCGLRSSDICNLKLSDIDWRNASVNIIQKKTGQQVNVPFSPNTGNALANYILNARGTSDLPYTFLKKSYSDSPMTSSLLCNRLKKLLHKAGIERPAEDKISMHSFRRSLGTGLIESGEDIELVAQILGHRDKAATKKYISVSEKMLQLCPLEMPKINERTESHE